MNGLSLADVIAVGSWMALLVALNVGFYAWFRLCNYVLDQVWPHALPPSSEPIDKAELRAIFQSYTPRSFTLPAHKGFRSDYQHEVVDLAERRRRIH